MVTRPRGRTNTIDRARSGSDPPYNSSTQYGNVPNMPFITNNDNLLTENIDEEKARFKRRARTFVEVSFQENTVKTTCLEGNTPFWKQSLSLPFHPPQNDFTPVRLQQIREGVHFSLFDEVVEDDDRRGGHLEGESTVRRERRYLGSLTIPFATIYETGRIDGIFRYETCVF